MSGDEDPTTLVVQTAEGPVRGRVEADGAGAGAGDGGSTARRYSFRGVPYAAPPLGPLRFMPPQPIAPWSEVRDCTKETPLPYTLYYSPLTPEFKIVGSEDCLYVEVVTSNIAPDKPQPVMFWIGGFRFAGRVDLVLDPGPLLAEGVVFVHCHSRLGPFGFLSIDDMAAPANNGLKDQVAALRWVRRNIAAFGGDPDNVTLFGHSSGAACVHMLVLSPLAAGLFHRAVLQSGSALNSWALCKSPTPAALELARRLGVERPSAAETVDALRTVPADRLMAAFAAMELHAMTAGDAVDALFKPCVETEFEGQPALLTRSPSLLIKAGRYNKVPLMVGSSAVEGAVVEFVRRELLAADFARYNAEPALLVPRALAADRAAAAAVGRQLLDFYVGGDGRLSEQTRSQFLQFMSDFYFLFYVNKAVRLHSAAAPAVPLYYYVVTSAGQWAAHHDRSPFNSLGHCAETPFLFALRRADGSTVAGSQDSLLTRRRVARLWANFAKFGCPTPDGEDPLLKVSWPPVAPERLHYLAIGGELTVGRDPFQHRIAFWDRLHHEHAFLCVLLHLNDLGIAL